MEFLCFVYFGFCQTLHYRCILFQAPIAIAIAIFNVIDFGFIFGDIKLTEGMISAMACVRANLSPRFMTPEIFDYQKLIVPIR